MGTYSLLTLSTDELLAETLANRFRALLEDWDPGKRFSIALSGGRVAQPFFRYLRAGDGLARREIHFFWADERCVPPADAESNFRVAQEELFIPLEIRSDQIHRIRAEMPVDYAVAEAQAEICRICPVTSEGQPILSLIILGMGEDGHVASLFPGEAPGVMESTAVYRPVIGQKPPFQRITIGYSAIAAAEKVWVAVSGPKKEVPLAEVVSGHGQNPLSHVIRLREQTEVLAVK